MSPNTRQQFIADLTITALEGGIGYWSYATSYRHNDGAGPVTATILPDGVGEDEESVRGEWELTEPYVFIVDRGVLIDSTVIERGIELLRAIPAYREGYWASFLEAEESNGEDGDFDAETADVIVQFGLFGELVYG